MINLSLPLSATALRKGAEFMTQMAQLAEVIRDEANPQPVFKSDGSLVHATGITSLTVNPEPVISDPTPGGSVSVTETTLADDVATAEAATVTQYETVVTGHERNPDYAGANAAFDQDALIAAGWTVELLVQDGYLREVTEQRPLAPAPTVAPAAPAPAPSAPPGPAATGAAVEVDKDGFPYDPRIHAKSDTPLTKEGFWKTKKNLPDGYKAQIEAELRQVMAASGGTTASVSAPAPSPAAPPAPAAAPPAPAPAAAPAAPGAMTFADFTRYLVGNKIDQGKVVVQVQKVGLTSIPDLAKHPDLIPAVVEGLKG